MQIIFTRNATISIKSHFEVIKENNGIGLARSFRKKIFDRTKFLQTFPRMGPKAEEFSHIPVEIRFLIEGKYKNFYQPTDETLFILNVVDSRQNPSTIDLL